MTTILLSGIAGFLGSAYARHVLETTDWDIVGLDRIDEAASLSRIPSPHWGRIKLVWHDLRAAINPTHSEALRQNFRYVVHMAAASHVDRSVKDPMGFIMDNVVGTGNLLEFVRAMPEMPEKVYVQSTDEVFGPADGGENFTPYDRHWAANPYSASKSAAECLCSAWAMTYGLPIVVCQGTNIVGPSQFIEKYVPGTIAKVKRDAVVQIHARGGAPSSRFYIYVDDVARAVQTILERGGTMQSPNTGKYSFSADAEHSNLYVARKIAQLLGKELKYELVDFVSSRPRHDQRYAVDSSALRALGWAPQVGIDEALRLCVEASG